MADSMDKKYSNVPILRFPEFNDEWKLTSYNLLFEFQNGINGSPEKYGKGIKYISVMDILNNQYITYSNIKGLIDATEKEQQNFMVGYGDVLFQRSSETPEDAGKSNVYLDSKPCVFGGFVIRGKKIGNYNPIFIKYALASNANRKKMIRLGAGAQHVNIGQNNLNSLKISLPSEFEQEKIALLFDAIDKKIETQNKIIGDLNSQYLALINNCFSGGPNAILNSFIKEESSRNKSGNDYPVFSVSNKKGFIPQNEQFDDREVASDDKTNYRIVETNQFAYNPARINVGSIGLYNKSNPCIISPMYNVFSVKNIEPFILELFFKSIYFENEMKKRLEGSVRMCLTINGLKSIKFHLPDEQYLNHFIKLMTALKNKMNDEERVLILYLRQKKYLLNQLFI